MARDYTATAVDVSTLPHPKVQLAARDAIEGKTHGLRAILPFVGPAFIACIAYIDPGNFATNIQGGAQFGYALLWVVLMANLMAMVIQSLAAKLGIATGLNLAEMCRARFAPWVCYCLWITQEVTAMATDLAEFLGAAIGITLLTGLSAVRVGGDHRGRRVRDPGAPGQGVSPARGVHRRLRVRDRGVLRHRDVPGQTRLGAGLLSQFCPQPAGQ